MQKDKARDIARGVLPSKARKGARDNKRNFHAVHRHAQRQTNHAILRATTAVDDDGHIYTDPDLFDDFDGPTVYDGYHPSTLRPVGWDATMSGIVDDRRNADKLGPLIAWASATERNKMTGWADVDKYNYFKAVLPDTLQGRHALGHVESALDINPDRYYYGWRRKVSYYTLENFRADLTRHLSTAKARRSLRDFLYETIPVASHSVPTNNGHLKREQARDETGVLRYDVEVIPADPSRAIPPSEVRTPIMVDVWIPQMVSVTCETCTFLRNDPLATPDAVRRFTDVIWDGRHPGGDTGERMTWTAQFRHRKAHRDPVSHGFSTDDVIDYIKKGA